MKLHNFVFRIITITLISVYLATIFSSCTSDIQSSPTSSETGNSEQSLEEALNNGSLTPEEREALEQQLLKNYAFYQGRVTVFENQKWTSTGQDGSHGEGDTTLSTDEILIYDAETQKCYILVRYMSCSGAHGITVNNPNGDFLGYSDIVHSGELYEYYGTGFLWKKDLDVASASDSLISQYTLNFAANPVRMDNARSVIFTYPQPRQVDWVTYMSISGTDRRGGIRMWPPEENTKNTDLDLIPTLSQINDSNTYNSDESWLYEATDRIWTPSGTFSYDYYRISYTDAMAEMERLRVETAAAGSFGAMAENHPPAWQETATMADEFGTAASATQNAETVISSVLPQEIIDALESRNAADLVANEKAFQDFISEMKPGTAGAANEGADEGVVRKLEGVIIGTSDEGGAGPQQKNLKNSFNTVKLYLEALQTKYVMAHDSLQQTITKIKAYPVNSQDYPIEQVNTLLLDCRVKLKDAVKLSQQTEILLGDIGVVLHELNAMGEVDDETKYAELNRLFALWEEDFIAAENVNVDVEAGVRLPDDYPSNVIPVISGAIVVITERIPGEDGAGDGYAITLKSGQSTTEVVQYYKNFLRSTPGVSEFSFSGITTISGEKDGYEFSIMVMNNNLGGTEKSVIQISLTPLE